MTVWAALGWIALGIVVGVGVGIALLALFARGMSDRP